VLKENVKPV